MIAPFFKYGLFGAEVSLIVAFLIGIAFGFVLERAGFGNARVLAAQFYFRDLRVLKVMFTAIVTAMVGLFLLARFGFVDLALIYLTPTFLVPQIAGGLILGAGFIIGGYCPGTSCVSAATGRIDGMVFLAGMMGGLLGYAEIHPHIARFATSTPLGQLTLAQAFDIPYGVLVFAVVVMALGAFVAAEWAELKIGGKHPDSGSLLAPTWRLTPVRRFALLLVGGGLVAAFAGSPYRGPFARGDATQLALAAAAGTDRIDVDRLATWLVEGRNDFVLIDVRDTTDFERYHLPAAISVPLGTLTAESVPRDERLICYDNGDTVAAQAVARLRSLGFVTAYSLAGGLPEWRETVLFPLAPAADAPPEAHREFARRAAIAKSLGGEPRGDSGNMIPIAPELPKVSPPRSVAPASTPIAVRKRKEGC